MGEEFGHETISEVAAVGKNEKGQNQYVKGQNAVVFGAGTIGLAIAAVFQYFGMKKVMICDDSEYRLQIARSLGFETCHPVQEIFIEKAMHYFGLARSLQGNTADIDCWADAAHA